ncbi:MAG: hypothetical protein B7Y90_10525 [Alphaproteobacteria bacterium 32-64-14]|nr:MAG: hypothetical protein B7Y90_10525 [Alphaproteobacteria bacterium 32-64-14]
MIDSQVRPNDVTDRRLISAMSAVAREAFVPASRRAVAYAEMPIETAPGRWMMAARDFSKLVNALAIREGERILDIAPGTGYSSAVLSRLGAVVALEEGEAAQALTAGLAGVQGVEIVTGSLKAGAPGKGPFDAILVNGAVEVVPQAWLDQLAEGGRLAVAVNDNGTRRARVYTRSGGKTAWLTPFDSSPPALPGFEKAAEFRL